MFYSIDKNIEIPLKKNLSKISIIVIRIDKNNELKNSKPCYDCIQTLKQYGFKKICYSTGDKKCPFIIERIKNIENNHRSQMTRHINLINQSKKVKK